MASVASPSIKAVIFDVGNVLIPWDPRRAFAPLFGERTAELDYFLSYICTMDWHTEHDRGVPFSKNIARRQAEYPAYADMIAAFETHWDEMFDAPIRGTIDIVRQLHGRGYPLYALTNFAADKFDRFRRQHDFMSLFADAIVSGEEKLVKPDPRLYQILLDRASVPASHMLFIDDRAENLTAAAAFGIQTILFTDAAQLRRDLTARGLLLPA